VLVGPVSGALVDRLDRHRLMWTVDLAHATVLAGVVAARLLAGGAIERAKAAIDWVEAGNSDERAQPAALR
jgi:hypothetical protein